MGHFSSPQWIDLVRGVLAGDLKGDMENHLNSGCHECLDAHSLWQRFTRFAHDERKTAPPEEAVTAAKSLIAGTPDRDSDRSPWAWAASFIPTLVFDSLQEAPVGVRAAAAPTGRYLLYAANDLMIDLHIDAGPRAGAVLLAGQVANAAQPGHPLPETRVALVKGKEELAVYRVNPLGEFHCEFERQAQLALLVTVQGRDPIVIPLERLFEPAAGDSVPRSKHSRC
jgi:hypothetical protein